MMVINMDKSNLLIRIQYFSFSLSVHDYPYVYFHDYVTRNGGNSNCNFSS